MKKCFILLVISQFVLVSIKTLAQNPEWIIYDTSNSGLTSNAVSSIAIDASGNKWIGTGFGLVKFDGQNWTVYQIPANTNVTTVTIDISGNIWAGTFNNGLWKFDGTNWTETTSWVAGEITATAIDLSGNIWIGYMFDMLGGLAKFDGTNWTNYGTSNSGLPSNVVNSITIDTDGSKWIGTSGGLARFKDTNWTVYDTSNSAILYDVVTAIAIDASGNKWIGNNGGFLSDYTGSLSKFDGTNWTVYDTSNSGLPGNLVKTIAIENGIIWVGAWRHVGGLAKFDGTSWTVYDTSNSDLPSYMVNSITIDASGNKWIGTNNGLAVYKEGGVTFADNIINAQNTILYPNYPNPVYQSTTFRFYLPQKSDVSLKIYDLQGKEITTLVNQMKEKGEHSVQFNADGLSSGIYFYRLQTDDYIKTMKMMVIK